MDKLLPVVVAMSGGVDSSVAAALLHPERYYAAASLSGVLSMAIMSTHPDDERQPEFMHLFGDLSKVMAQPYDRIGPDLQQKYYELHPYNITRLIKGKELEDDDATHNVYTRAGEYYHTWLDAGYLLPETQPALVDQEAGPVRFKFGIDYLAPSE